MAHLHQVRETQAIRRQMRVYETVLILRGKEIDRVAEVTTRQIDELMEQAAKAVELHPMRLPDVQAGKEVLR